MPSQHGPKKTLHQSIKKQLWKLYDRLAKWILIPPARLLRAGGWNYQFVNIGTASIGHLAIEPDLFIKEGRLGLRPTFKELWLAPPEKGVNQHLLGYWAQHLRTVQSPLLARLLQPLARSPRLTYDVSRYAAVINGTALYPAIQSAWGRRPPLLCLNQSDREYGGSILKKLGIPEGAWFVCVHCRESGYMPQYEQAHRYRDGDILTYVAAMKAIVERGGWCIRVGDPSMKPLPPMPQVIDYAVHELKSDRMDVFLCGACRCFLGCSSGLALAAGVFGVPVAMANQAPFSAVFPIGVADLGIPKRLRSIREQRPLAFQEILSSPLANYRFSHLYEEAGVEVLDNTPDEIRELAVELLAVANGTMRYSAEDEELQRAFKSLLRPGHYSYGAQSRIGRHFLSKHAPLLSQP